MKIIIGLGNPGEQYKDTRHNIGFAVVEKIQTDWDSSPFEFNKKFNAEISKGSDILLAKPQTFMNLSSETVRAILDFYKLTPADIIVIHDDLDIAIGKYKLATDSSSAGHNGVADIIEKLGTQKFKRVRVGIGQEKDGAPICRADAHDFVLAKFSDEERKKTADIVPAILEEIKKLL
jgi:PTH1 family peptidyl-tRNA hydrolase